MNNLTVGGSNIPTPGAGKKTVTVDLSKFPYTVSVQYPPDSPLKKPAGSRRAFFVVGEAGTLR